MNRKHKDKCTDCPFNDTDCPGGMWCSIEDDYDLISKIIRN